MGHHCCVRGVIAKICCGRVTAAVYCLILNVPSAFSGAAGPHAGIRAAGHAGDGNRTPERKTG